MQKSLLKIQGNFDYRTTTFNDTHQRVIFLIHSRNYGRLFILPCEAILSLLQIYLIAVHTTRSFVLLFLFCSGAWQSRLYLRTSGTARFVVKICSYVYLDLKHCSWPSLVYWIGQKNFKRYQKKASLDNLHLYNFQQDLFQWSFLGIQNYFNISKPLAKKSLQSLVQIFWLYFRITSDQLAWCLHCLVLLSWGSLCKSYQWWLNIFF